MIRERQDKGTEFRHSLDPMHTLIDTNSCTISTHTRTVQYHPLSSLYLSPDSSLHSLAPLSVKKKKRQIKMNVFSFSLSQLSFTPLVLLPLQNLLYSFILPSPNLLIAYFFIWFHTITYENTFF